MKLRICALMAATLISILPPQTLPAQSPEAQIATDAAESKDQTIFRKRVADVVLEVCDLILEEHIDPPAKQQMVLAAAKAAFAYEQTQADAAGDAGEVREPKIRRPGRDVSKLGTDEEIEQFLMRCFDEIGVSEASHPSLANRLIETVLMAAPGGGQLTLAPEVKVETQLAENRYVGIGIALSQASGRPHITKCFYGGSGFNSGVRTNDLILKIDGVDTANKELREIVEQLRGEEGTEVMLVLRQSSALASETREVTVSREVTFIPTVTGSREDENGKWIHRLDPESDLALLKIERFGPSTVHELRKLASTLTNGDSPVKGIILDLRRGGGTVKDVVMVADQFLEKAPLGGTVFADRQRMYESQPGSLFKGVELVVLVDRTSSASSVLLASALRDNDRADLVGNATSGVSFVRGAYTLSTGDRVVFPTGFIRRANGVLMRPPAKTLGFKLPVESQAGQKGAERALLPYLVPDYPVAVITPPTINPPNAQQGPALTRAIQVLRAKIRSKEKGVATRSKATNESGS